DKACACELRKSQSCTWLLCRSLSFLQPTQANHLPSPLKQTLADKYLAGRLSRWKGNPPRVPQMLTPSRPAAAKYFPSELKAIEVVGPTWDCISSSSFHDATS